MMVQPEPTSAALKGLQAARAVRAALQAAGVPVVRLTPLEKLQAHPTSLRAAINARCFQCEGCDADPKVRYRIGTCTVTSCALWGVRPYQHISLASDDGDTAEGGG